MNENSVITPIVEGVDTAKTAVIEVAGTPWCQYAGIVVVAAVVGYGLYKSGKWLLNRREASVPDAPTEPAAA